LKPEWRGSLLVQEERYQEKPVKREEIIIIIIIIIIMLAEFSCRRTKIFPQSLLVVNTELAYSLLNRIRYPILAD
jgi:hypothetical protein